MEEQLKKLQDDFALVDLLTSNKRSSMLEILLKKFLPIKLKMYQEEHHQTPHIHIDYGKENHVASYSIKDGERLVGNLSSKYDKTVKFWISQNQVLLMNIWNEIQDGNEKKYEILIDQL